MIFKKPTVELHHHNVTNLDRFLNQCCGFGSGLSGKRQRQKRKAKKGSEKGKKLRKFKF
jgi:hypothetical protein